METSSLKIGAWLWLEDHNHREYDSNRQIVPGCEFRKYWIIGETRDSWIISPNKGATPDKWDWKIGKKDLKTRDNKGYSPKQCYSPQGRIDKAWFDKHTRYIALEIHNCEDRALLEKIGHMLGYKFSD